MADRRLLLGRSLPRREPAMNEGFPEMGLPLALDLGVDRFVLPAPNVLDLVPLRHHHVHGRLLQGGSNLRPEVPGLALGKLSHCPQIVFEVPSIGGLDQVETQADEDRHRPSLVSHGGQTPQAEQPASVSPRDTTWTATGVCPNDRLALSPFHPNPVGRRIDREDDAKDRLQARVGGRDLLDRTDDRRGSSSCSATAAPPCQPVGVRNCDHGLDLRDSQRATGTASASLDAREASVRHSIGLPRRRSALTACGAIPHGLSTSDSDLNPSG